MANSGRRQVMMDHERRRTVKHDLAVEVLRSFGHARLPVKGSSMLPSLWPGDILAVRRENAESIRPGEVVVFLREGKLVAHRVVEGATPLLVTRGDRRTSPDAPVSAADVLGRVISIERGRRRKDPRLTLFRRFIAWALRRSELTTRVLLHIQRRFGPHSWPLKTASDQCSILNS
jgi:signal peptidase I